MSNSQILNKIKQSVKESTPLIFTTYIMPYETEREIEEIVAAYLEELGQSQLKDHLIYCVRELAANAKKANTKRVYFENKKLDISSTDDYKKGMQTFKKDTLENHNYWLNLQKQYGLYIKFIFHPYGRDFKISIRNNVEITRKEQMRVYDRIARSRVFKTLDEVFAEVLDDSEGAGLGIVILILMLRKMGLKEDAYEIEGDNGFTVSSITIPINHVKLQKMEMLMNQIVNEIDHLPKFPENIVAIQKLINDSKSKISDIARKISTDPTLTADLLKTVNSAQFMLPNKVDNIVEAVKLLGLRGVKNMLFNHGAEKLLDMSTYKDLWNHAHRVAFYSFNLAHQITRSRDILEDAYVGGILHDIGKIIFAAVHPGLQEKIKSFSETKDISASLFEDLASGYNHAEIGAKVAEKWNFSESLVNSIRFHHSPNDCQPENRLIVYCIYLGNAICSYSTNRLSFDQFDHSILAMFRITTEEQLKEIEQRLIHDYDTELNAS